jgi:hypothetical protein
MAVRMRLRPEQEISLVEGVFFAGQTPDIVCWALFDVAHPFRDRQERGGDRRRIPGLREKETPEPGFMDIARKR